MAPDQLDLFRQQAADPAFDIRESRRARHLSIHVSDYRGVEVVVPPRTRPGEIRRFVEANRDWIRRAREELNVSLSRPRVSLPDRIELRVNVSAVAVTYNASTPKKGWRESPAGVLQLACQQHALGPGRRYLGNWLQHQGKRILTPMLAARAEQMGMTYRRVQVRGQRTRWGSYSSTGTLAINYCLLFVPPDLADYLFIHELCHTVHMNHSARFWRLVSRYAPNYKLMEQRLNDGRQYLPDWLSDA